MAIFLTQAQLFRLLQRELPEDAYPDGAASAFYHTADMDSVAKVYSSVYSNGNRIYDNFFPLFADEKIDAWLVSAFGVNHPYAILSLADKRQKILDKLQQRPGLDLNSMADAVRTVLGPDVLFEIIEWSGADGGWVLDESELDISTILRSQSMVDVTPTLFPGIDLCTANPASYGKTADDLAQMQEEAYTYEVLIYDHTLTAQERIDLDQTLTKREPARSDHILTDGLDSNDMIGGDT